MQKITYLTLVQFEGSQTLDINLTPLIEQLGVLDKALEVTAKYEPMLSQLANELLDVIKDAAEEKLRSEVNVD
ncbi:MAG TPA: hypothetical protein DEF30_08375 [Proteiniclasticum sp.]|uniref:hypothetical protein n=1 Tax=Proteiniclasticum sp. TaxID=2053595 RepID=UPI000E868AED|nr:hypothetical protein [Proteiniclasticum sp.]HBW13816.1 hypothetical protein [Proteiniclasticum sp.]